MEVWDVEMKLCFAVSQSTMANWYKGDQTQKKKKKKKKNCERPWNQY